MKNSKHIKLIVTISLFALIANSCKDENDSYYKPDIPIFDQNVKDLVDEINADSLEKKVQWLEDMGSRFAVNDDRKAVAKRIRDRFISYGYTNAKLDSFYVSLTTRWSQTYYTWQYNVIATLEGSVTPSWVYVMGGHYDSIIGNDGAYTTAPGANDNASGVAATLEVARVLKEQGFNPQSTIEFIAFAAEEFGLYGSTDYAEKARYETKNIKFMLNNDMIAYWPVSSNNMRVNILDYNISTEIREKAQDYCNLYTLLETINDNYYQKYSDSYSFYLNSYKAIYFTTDADDPYYHTINDVTANCNFEICKEITKVNCAMLVDYNK
ncbi:MAG: Zn-dependent exopeptidase M28 [Bacteroidales bacterium]|nr:MAG: Zn-dependent exopeptidase M28 [Bacteroidales bacterium]